MKRLTINPVFFFCTVLLMACSPVISKPPDTFSVTPTAVPIPISTSQPSIETSIAILETVASNFRPVETYYEEIDLVWLECEVPQEYYHNWRFAANCLDMELPSWQEEDRQRLGERFQRDSGELDDLRLIIGKDIFETKHQGTSYELMRNGETIASTNSIFSTFDPNRSLLNVNNIVVWELAGLNSDQTAIDATVIYDGVNLLDKFSLDEAYIPYVINDKLIFVAKKSEQYFVLYDEKELGPYFDEISIGYCCEPAAYSVWRAQDQYWFWGTRDGKYYVVALFSSELR